MNILATLIFVLGGLGHAPVIGQPMVVTPIQQAFQITPYLLCLPGEVVERAGAVRNK
ncbi:MAG: hypothetical protein JRF33_06495 [Deltaproteobacteria bacterium]|nr:hypothetical protein [Deltaproteobacteria bacterium]